MKTINIRFVEHTRDGWGRTKDKPSYTIQEKKFLRWSTIGYWQNGGVNSVWNIYSQENRDSLLEVVLEEYFKRPKSQVIICEHPMIKYY